MTDTTEAGRLAHQFRSAIKGATGVTVREIDGTAEAIAEGLFRLHKLSKSAEKHREPWPTAPTRERIRQAGGIEPVEIEVHKDQPKAHAMRSYIDLLRGRLPDEHIAAALRLRTANELVHGGSRVVGYEEATGGVGYRPRLELTERQQMAGAFRAAMIVGWCDKQRAVIDNFVFEVPTPGGSRCLTAEEFGIAHGTTRNPKLAKSETFGMVAVTLSALHRRVSVWDQDQAEIKRRARRAEGVA